MKARNLLMIVAVCMTGLASPGATEDKRVVGWLENITIYPEKLSIRAKLDTGARHSSLNAPEAELFLREGDTWVRFEVFDFCGKRSTLERKLHRVAKIKRHDRPPALRQVVHLTVCLGGTFKTTQVNLEDRSGFNYQMLIGRSFLREDFLVDASAEFTTKPSCRGARSL